MPALTRLARFLELRSAVLDLISLLPLLLSAVWSSDWKLLYFLSRTFWKNNS